MPTPTPHRVAPQSLITGLLGLLGLVSALAMVLGARKADHLAVTLAAGAFVLPAGLLAVVVNRRASKAETLETARTSFVVSVLQLNTRLAAIAYGWGAVTMQLMYVTPITSQRWQHAWQYALVMALMAVGSLLIARRLGAAFSDGDPIDQPVALRATEPFAAVQALVAGAGLAGLAVTGKLWSTRADWAANRVFVGLAVAILVVSLCNLVMSAQLPRRD